MSNNIITLKTCDGQFIDIDNDIAMKSEYLKDILGKRNNDNEHGNKDPIEPDNITALSLLKVLLINIYYVIIN